MDHWTMFDMEVYLYAKNESLNSYTVSMFALKHAQTQYFYTYSTVVQLHE